RLVRVLAEDGPKIFASEGDFKHLAHGLAVIDSQQRGGHESSGVTYGRTWIIGAHSKTVKDFAKLRFGAYISANCSVFMAGTCRRA
ncbi:MAG: hypothetical protein ABI627_08830, partial [Polyangiaceae bacterium]